MGRLSPGWGECGSDELVCSAELGFTRRVGMAGQSYLCGIITLAVCGKVNWLESHLFKSFETKKTLFLFFHSIKVKHA